MLFWKTLRWLARRLERFTAALHYIGRNAENAVSMHIYELENHPDDVSGLRSWWGRY